MDEALAALDARDREKALLYEHMAGSKEAANQITRNYIESRFDTLHEFGYFHDKSHPEHRLKSDRDYDTALLRAASTNIRLNTEAIFRQNEELNSRMITLERYLRRLQWALVIALATLALIFA